MALYIHCGFARVAIRHLIKEHAEANGHYNVGYDIILKYNVQFGEVPGVKLEGNSDYILKKCKELNATFSQKWHPQENLHSYFLSRKVEQATYLSKITAFTYRV
jgi:RNase P protein component